MALKVRNGLPPFVPVPLGAGAFFRLRAATSDEIESAASAIGFQTAAILQGSAEADALAGMLPGFDFGDLRELAGKTRPETRELLDNLGISTRLDRLRDRLLLIELCAVCNDGWVGVVDEGGNGLASDRGGIAMLLVDAAISEKCRARVYAAVHEEFSEGKGLPASPDGGAGAPVSATTAEQSASPAQTV